LDPLKPAPKKTPHYEKMVRGIYGDKIRLKKEVTPLQEVDKRHIIVPNCPVFQVKKA
jgi:hypothetical protein